MGQGSAFCGVILRDDNFLINHEDTKNTKLLGMIFFNLNAGGKFCTLPSSKLSDIPDSSSARCGPHPHWWMLCTYPQTALLKFFDFHFLT
jgi:hypothetical protein